MWKILVLTESSSEKGAKRCKQIYCTSSGSGDIHEKRKVEKQGDVFFCYRLYRVLGIHWCVVNCNSKAAPRKAPSMEKTAPKKHLNGLKHVKGHNFLPWLPLIIVIATNIKLQLRCRSCFCFSGTFVIVLSAFLLATYIVRFKHNLSTRKYQSQMNRATLHESK